MLYLLLIIYSSLAPATNLPSNLTTNDQVEALETLGLGTSVLSPVNSWPLGGYSGFSLGLESTIIDTSALKELGDADRGDDQIVIPTLSLSKGLYEKMDMTLYAFPAFSGLSRYGAGLRWSFYQALFLPLNFSISINGGGVNFKNQLVVRNFSTDLQMGLRLGNTSFISGIGYTNASGVFTGGTDGRSSSGNQENHKVESPHIHLSALYHFSSLYLGASFDRHILSVYSFRAGFLF